MKFIHTADWQLGRNFNKVAGKADALRTARLSAVKNIVGLADKEKVDAVIVAGDIFEHNRIDFHWVREMSEALKQCRAPVYLLPGNHDPIMRDSPYELHEKLFVPPIFVLRDETPVSLAGATLFPCPARATHGDGDPTVGIPPREASHGIRIGVAHGAIKGTPDECGYHIPKDAADRLDLDYLALGHWHRAKEEGPQCWYAGTPESCEFGDDGGFALVVEVAGPRAEPRVKKVGVSTYEWCDFERNIHGEGDLLDLEQELDRLQGASSKLVRLRLKGHVATSVLTRVEALESTYGSRFFHLQFENHVYPAKDSSIEYQNVILRKMAEKLSAKTAGTSDPTLSYSEQEAARRALSHLAALVADSGHGDLV